MEPKKSYIGIKNSVDSSTLELYFTDFIFDGYNWYGPNNMVQDMIDKITAASPSKINLTINSLGGDVMIGLAIYNFLKNYKAKVSVEIIGFAASIASIIAMSASKGQLKIAKNGFMIIHAASSLTDGNAKELRDEADLLDRISAELADIYALRSGKEAKYFIDLWADGGDVWLTGKEAKEMGLADELINAVAINAKLNLEAFGFKNIPTNITSSISQTQKLNMAFTKTIATAKAESFSVVEGGFLLEEPQLNNIEAALDAADVAATAATTALATANASLTAANASLATANEELISVKATAGAAKTTNSTQAARIIELETQVAALGKQPSGTGTTPLASADPLTGGKPVPAFLDASAPENVWADRHMPKPKKA